MNIIQLRDTNNILHFILGCIFLFVTSYKLRNYSLLLEIMYNISVHKQTD